MPKNKEGILIRQAAVLEGKLKGKTSVQLSEELEKDPAIIETGVGTSHDTISNDWRDLRKDSNLMAGLEELKLANLQNAISATEVEKKYVKTQSGNEKITSNEIQAVNTIKNSSQKIYSFVAGANSDDKAGDVPDTSHLLGGELASALIDRLKN